MSLTRSPTLEADDPLQWKIENSKNVQRVEAWTRKAEPSDLPDSFTFRFRPVGTDWKAEESGIMHPSIWNDLDFALNYCLLRGAGKVCRIELLNTRGALQWLILSDERANDAYAGIGPTWKPEGSLLVSSNDCKRPIIFVI